MDVTVSYEKNTMIVTVVGRIDSTTSSELEAWAREALNPPEYDVVMDFSRLDYISSAGLRTMLNISKSINKYSHTFALCRVQDHIREVFEISGFDSFIPIYRSREESLASLP